MPKFFPEIFNFLGASLMLCSFELGRMAISVGRLVKIVSGSSFTPLQILVDLAGSERVEQSLSSGVRLVPAKCINSLLICLRNVIRDQLSGAGCSTFVFSGVFYIVYSLFVMAEYQQI